jgi:hypothetical protein|tara:strand:+ start:1451 stop:1978 length:528 start_codon:yes stop_codon:yes gene_type:complete
MLLISNHLTQLEQFKKLKDVVIRINMAHVKDSKQLEKFVNVPYDVFLDYPKGRSKPPLPSSNLDEAIAFTKKYNNIKYFATSNIEEIAEVDLICEMLPEGVNFVPKIETLKGVLNLSKLFDTGKIKHIMLDSEDLYTNIQNDVELFINLKERVRRVCKNYKVECLELYGVIFNGK